MAKPLLQLESTIEGKSVKYIESLGYYAIKIIRKGWPDRMVQLNNGRNFYIEFKRLGEKPDELQKHIHNQLRLLGCSVYVCTSVDEVKNVLKLETDKHDRQA